MGNIPNNTMKLPLPQIQFGPDGLTAEHGYSAEYAEEIRNSMPHAFAPLSEWWWWKYNYGAPSDVVGDEVASSCELISHIFDNYDIKQNVGSAKAAISKDSFSLMYFNAKGKGRGVTVEIDQDDRACYNVRIASPGRGEPAEFYCHTEREVASILVSFFRTKKHSHDTR